MNIIITGLGGQGINTLYEVLQSSLLLSGQYCKGAIFKGGAQKRGSVYAAIRIFEDEETGQYFSPTVSPAQLDVLLGLEANEAMRYDKTCNQSTQLVINQYTFPFYKERFKDYEGGKDPIPYIKEAYGASKLFDFNAFSQQHFGHQKMINILIGLYAIDKGFLPIDRNSYLSAFHDKISIKYEDMLILLEENFKDL